MSEYIGGTGNISLRSDGLIVDAFERREERNSRWLGPLTREELRHANPELLTRPELQQTVRILRDSALYYEARSCDMEAALHLQDEMRFKAEVENERLREALKFYAPLRDNGAVARAALEGK